MELVHTGKINSQESKVTHLKHCPYKEVLRVTVEAKTMVMAVNSEVQHVGHGTAPGLVTKHRF